MWFHTVFPPLSPQICTGSLPAASCDLEAGSSSSDTSPSGNWGPDVTNKNRESLWMWQWPNVEIFFNLGNLSTYLWLGAGRQQGHEGSFCGTREEVLRRSCILVGWIRFCVAQRTFQALPTWWAGVCTCNQKDLHKFDQGKFFHLYFGGWLWYRYKKVLTSCLILFIYKKPHSSCLTVLGRETSHTHMYPPLSYLLLCNN